MTINKRLSDLRSEMSRHDIDIYVVPTCDFHGSEYIGDYFKTREFISGFTGSAGTAVITKNKAYLWTDGRYFVQAESQLNDSYKLMKQGENGVPTAVQFIEEYNRETIEKNKESCNQLSTEKSKENWGTTVGFDGRTIPSDLAEHIEKLPNINVVCDLDLIGDIWKDRPEISHESVWILQEQYAGESLKEKIKKIQKEIVANDCDILVDTCLENIAWTLNLRGNDVKCTPVFLSFLTITGDNVTLYIQKQSLTAGTESYLKENKVNIKDYFEIYNDLKQLKDKKVWLDKSSANYRIIETLKNNNRIYNRMSPALTMKAIKNSTEIKNTRKAHLLDEIAMTKFIYWLKHNVGKEPMDEVMLGEKLEYFRTKAESYVEPSFEPIVGYNDHGAIVHYSATEETNYTITDKGLVLIDSGGHYLEGTTDITRTISLGEVSDKMKRMYTAVLKGHLALGDAVFKKGSSGVTLDILARKPLWDLGLDYNHGTGHGVGYLLSVHEPPNGIRYRILNNPQLNPEMKAGMITSNEPGIYLENEFGIRIENLILCKEKESNEFGEFLCFETLTLVPYDIELIDETMLTEKEKELIFEYNRRITDALQPYLTGEENKWLETLNEKH